MIRPPYLPDDILLADATAQASALRGRRISARELLDATLGRIGACNDALLALVAMDAEGARLAAIMADERFAAGTARPLEGLVVTIKDAFDVAGLPNTAGSPLYASRVPNQDAPAVARLRAAGAIVLGKTNVSEMLADLQCANPLHGVTLNPFNPERTSGGSSGGSAVAVATGMAALDLGSDLCGSIRWPAHCCGVFGFKPSWGAVPMAAHVPPPPGALTPTPFSTGGPLTRSGRDLSLAFAVLTGRQPKPVSKGGPVRVRVWARDRACTTQDEVATAVEEAGRLLARQGALVDKARLPPIDLDEAMDIFSLDVHSILSLGLSVDERTHMAANAACLDAGDRSAHAMRARAVRADPVEVASREERRNRIRNAWLQTFADVDAIICPPAIVEAIPHDATGTPYDRRISVDGATQEYFSLIAWSSAASVVDLPAAVVPVGLSRAGIPLGVQIIGACDESVLRVAAMFDRRRY